MKNKDLYSGIGILIVSAAYLMSTSSIRETSDLANARTMPVAVGIIAIILSAILIVTTILKMKKNGDGSTTKAEEKSNYKRVGITLALILAFIFSMDNLGFTVSAAVYLMAQMLILAEKEQRKIPKMAIISVVAAVSVKLLFTYVFNIVLPTGMIGF